jgi:hypothetical protein
MSSIDPSEPGGQGVEITSSDMAISLDENDVIFNESVHLLRGGGVVSRATTSS